MRGKTCVWLFWLFTTVISAGYGALSLFVFITLTKMKSRGYKANEGVDLQATANRYGLYAATILSFACVAFYVVFTLLVLLRKSFKAKAATGYGIILASAGQTGMILLLSALVLHAAKPRADYWKTRKWFTANDHAAYIGTFVIGYILAVIYVLNCLILLFFKPAMDYEAPPAPAPAPSITTSTIHQSMDPPPPIKLESVKLADVEDPAADPVDQSATKPKGFFSAWKK